MNLLGYYPSKDVWIPDPFLMQQEVEEKQNKAPYSAVPREPFNTPIKIE